MTKISGFSFIHNGIEGGYPFVEAIKAIRDYVDNIYVVDMQSTDGTRDILEQLDVNIINGFWGNEAGKTLRDAHSQHILCDGDIIWHFEADEVYEDRLCKAIKSALLVNGTGLGDIENIAVHRLQIEQNFQRARWYPEPVHRIFPNHSNIFKEGHTTNRQIQEGEVMPVEAGYLWDITNCFRDNWLNRVNKQAELRDTVPQYIMAGLHILHKIEWLGSEVELKFNEPHWTWKETPLAIPEILKPLVGMTKYEPIV